MSALDKLDWWLLVTVFLWMVLPAIMVGVVLSGGLS